MRSVGGLIKKEEGLRPERKNNFLAGWRIDPIARAGVQLKGGMKFLILSVKSEAVLSVQQP